MFTFVGASRGHLCDSTAFLYLPGFTFLVPAHPGSTRHSPGGRKTVEVVVVVVVVNTMDFEHYFTIKRSETDADLSVVGLSVCATA